MSTDDTPERSDGGTDQPESDDGDTEAAVGDGDPDRRGPDDGATAPDEDRPGGRDVVAYLEWGAVAGLGLVALVAVFRFYFAASRAIGIWISPDFEPLFQAAFNLVVLLFAAAGIVVFARRLR